MKSILHKIFRTAKFNHIIENQELILAKQNEQIWANKFYDSIRGVKGVGEVSYYVGNWAGSYTFFYLLSRILQEYRFNTICEFGLGESSKFINTYIENNLGQTEICQHDIFEQNQEFYSHFQTKFTLSDKTKVNILPIVEKEVFGFKNKMFDFTNQTIGSYDLYIIDGPVGSARFSRFDLFDIMKTKKSGDEFLVIFDDTNRVGEMDTLNYLMEDLKKRNILAQVSTYEGEKKVSLIATEKFKWALTY